MNRQKKIEVAKKNSNNQPAKLVYEDSKTREFMKFENGKVVEYDLTKAYGKSVRLTEEENNTFKFFNHEG